MQHNTQSNPFNIRYAVCLSSNVCVRVHFSPTAVDILFSICISIFPIDQYYTQWIIQFISAEDGVGVFCFIITQIYTFCLFQFSFSFHQKFKINTKINRKRKINFTLLLDMGIKDAVPLTKCIVFTYKYRKINEPDINSTDTDTYNNF